jgi:DNA-binding NtrC family response regulator
LDEIGEMPLELQTKLLKVIEDHRVRRLGGASEVVIDVQIVAASNLELRTQADQGRFRADLYHRLAVFTMELPPLRRRIADLEQLVPAFIAEFNAIAHKSVRVVPDGVWQRLLSYPWPGNVRELRNVVERCVLLSEGELLPSQWLYLEQRLDGAAAELPALVGTRLCLPLDGSMTLEAMDREIVKAALERCGSNATAAARLLGSTRETLRYRIQKHGLKSSDIE